MSTKYYLYCQFSCLVCVYRFVLFMLELETVGVVLPVIGAAKEVCVWMHLVYAFYEYYMSRRSSTGLHNPLTRLLYLIRQNDCDEDSCKNGMVEKGNNYFYP